MAQTKSFSVNREVEKPKEEKLYKTKTCPYVLEIEQSHQKHRKRLTAKHFCCSCFRCIAIPSLIAFTLLLVLANVDFDGDAYATTTRMPITRPVTTKTTTITTTISTTSTRSSIEEETTIAEPIAWISPVFGFNKTSLLHNFTESNMKSTDIARSSATYSKSDDQNNCNITFDGYVENFAQISVQQQLKCENKLHFLLRDCSFLNGKINSSLFDGEFAMQSLTIDNCNLTEVEDGAFKKSPLQNLTHLTIINSHLSELNNATFIGLQSIKYLQLLNTQSIDAFKGKHFLTPVAHSLQNVTIQQKSTKFVYDPSAWLGGPAKFNQLIFLNLSDNNFRSTLTERTFSNLVRVRFLYLKNCKINAIATSTFDAIGSTLTYLDLSNNQLVAIDWSFLVDNRDGNPLMLAINENRWRCTCENFHLLKALRTSLVINDIKTICTAPAEWENIDMISVEMNCIQEGRNFFVKNGTDSSSSSSSSSSSNSDSTADSNNSDKSESENEEDNTTTLEPIETTLILDTTPTPTTTRATTQITKSTTSASTSVTTNIPENLVRIVCPQPFTSDHKPFIRNYDAIFSIHMTSSTSIYLYIQGTAELNLVYFSPNDYRICDTPSIQNRNQVCSHQRLVSGTIIYVEDLYSEISYVFCVLPGQEVTTSPFNCRSHYMDPSIDGKDSLVWLYTSDALKFIMLSITGLVLSLTLGITTTYFLLRWRPTWLKGCQRLRRANSTSHIAFLLPKTSLLEEKNIQCENVNTNPTGDNNYHSRTMTQNGSHFYEFKPPIEKAPCIPPKYHKYNKQLSINKYLPSEYVYESVEYYEAVV